MAQPTTQLLSIVQKHLDLPQDDENVVLIAKFLVNLHGNSTLEEFKKVVKENGGEVDPRVIDIFTQRKWM